MAERRDEEEPKFEVKFISGYKGEETPRSVIIGKKEFIIEKIIERKRIMDKDSREQSEVFICKMEGDVVKIEKFESGEWSITFLDNRKM